MSQLDRIRNFEVFSRFVSQRFDVQIILDGNKAETDGTTISLPNVYAMTPRELDMLYAILLHEIGHIKYTNFDRLFFNQIKDEYHHFIFNALEDARIENLMMKDFDGAKDFFHNLYNDFILDQNLNKKIFGTELTRCSVDAAIALFGHYERLNLKRFVTFEQTLQKSSAKKAVQWYKTNNLLEILRTHPLETSEDALALATIIYNKKVEKSPKKGMFEKKNEELNQDAKFFDILKDSISKMQEKVSRIDSKIKELKETNYPLIENLSYEIESLQRRINQLSDKQSDAKDTFSYKDKQEKINKNINNRKDKVSDLTEKKLKADAQVKEYTEKRKVDEQGNPILTEKQEERLNSLKKKAQEIEKAIEKQTNAVKNKQKDLQELEKPKDVSPSNFDKSRDELKSDIASYKNEISKLKEQLTNEKNHKKSLEKQIEDAINEKKKINQDLNQKIGEGLQSISDIMKGHGIPVQGLPEFETTPGWDEFDTAQKEFDSKASNETGTLVCNGVGSGVGARNISILLDKTKEAIQNIDVRDLFKNINKNRIDTFGEETNYKNKFNTISSNPLNQRSHIPLSKEFDKIVIKNNEVSNIENKEFRKKYFYLVEETKNILKRKLLAQKKLRFKGNQEEGSLDNRSLWKLAANIDNDYYETSINKFINKVSCSILIDLSGSHDKSQTLHGEYVKAIALALSEGLSAAKVKHEVLGYHAPVCEQLKSKKSSFTNRNVNSLETIVFKKFDDRSHGILDLKIKCSDNSDGESLRIATKRLISQRANRRILFIISDGMPYLSNADCNVLDADLRKAIIEAEKQKIEIVSLSFSPNTKLFYKRDKELTKPKDILDFLKTL